MAGAGDEKGDREAGAAGREGANEAGSRGDGGGKSLAARRRRIEMMRERRDLLAMLDDFGDGEFDDELVLELADDEDDTRWVAIDQAGAEEEEDVDLGDDDDDYVDDDDEFPDED
jgi:hypothetical protein